MRLLCALFFTECTGHSTPTLSSPCSTNQGQASPVGYKARMPRQQQRVGQEIFGSRLFKLNLHSPRWSRSCCLPRAPCIRCTCEVGCYHYKFTALAKSHTACVVSREAELANSATTENKNIGGTYLPFSRQQKRRPHTEDARALLFFVRIRRGIFAHLCIIENQGALRMWVSL